MKTLLRVVLLVAVVLGMISGFLSQNASNKAHKRMVAGVINLPSCSGCDSVPR